MKKQHLIVQERIKTFPPVQKVKKVLLKCLVVIDVHTEPEVHVRDDHHHHHHHKLPSESHDHGTPQTPQD